MNLLKVSLIGALAALAAGSADAATNLLTNGVFETGDFTGWSLTGYTGFAGVSGNFGGVAPQEGAFQYFNGAVGSEGYLSQAFSDVAGAAYTVTGWAASPFGGGYFNLLLDSVSFGAASSGQAYTEYSGNFVGSGSDTLTIVSQNGPSYNLFDNFSVSTVIPEPTTWATMLLGFGLCGAVLRRRDGLGDV